MYILRKGVADRGAKFKLAYFKPASGMNPEHQTLYQEVRFSLVRQLKSSLKFLSCTPWARQKVEALSLKS